MKDTHRYELGARRAEWGERIRRALRKAGRQQKEVAYDIAAAVGDEGPKTTAVNNFVNGRPDALRLWFEDRPEWIDLLVAGTELTRTELQALLDGLRRDTLPSACWNPAFPEVAPEQVEIAAVFAGGKTAADLAGELARFAVVRVVAEPGATRDIAVRQLRAQLGDKVTVEGTARREMGAWQEVVLGGWGPVQAKELAEKLVASGSLGAAEVAALGAFATRLAAEPGLVGHGLPPGVVVEWLAAVAQDGCPRSVVESRSRMTAGAWARATRTTGHLADLDERLLERVCAGLASRAREASEVGGWTSAPWPVVVGLVDGALDELYGAVDRRTLFDLAERIAQSKKEDGRKAALDELRRVLERRPAESVTQELVEAGILVEVPGPAARHVRFARTFLAAVWAARGLGRAPTGMDWSRLVDPEYGPLVEELGRHGVPLDEVTEALRDAPPELAIDASLWILRHAAGSAPLTEDARIVGAWADVLWAVAHRVFSPWGFDDPWTDAAGALLRDLSWRLRAWLPRLDDDPVAAVRPHLSPAAAAIVDRARARAQAGSQLLRAFRSEGDLAGALRWWAPAQNLPDTPARWRWWFGRPGGLGLVVEAAEAGSVGCRALLSGEALHTGTPDDRQNAAAFWQGCPLQVRLQWATRYGPRGDPGVDLLVRLAREVGTDPEGRTGLVALAVELGAETLESAALVHLERFRQGWFEDDSALWLAFAERLSMKTLLEYFARPGWLRGARLVRQPGLGFSLRLRDGSGPGLQMTRERKRLGRVSFDVDAIRARGDDLALKAAVALYRLGEPDTLRRRWREGGEAWDEEFLRSVGRVEALLTLLDVAPGRWAVVAEMSGAPAVPWEALVRRALPEEPRPWDLDRLGLDVSRALDFGWGALSAVHEIGAEAVSDQVALAIHGVWCLLQEPTRDDLEPELAAFLDGLGGRLREGPFEVPPAGSREALDALLDHADPEPVRAWCEREEDPRGLADRITMHHISGRLEKDPRLLEVAWRLPELARHPERRDRVLHDAVVLRSAAPMVVAEALREPDLERVTRWSEWNEGHRDWLPVLRRLIREAPDRRTAARAAVAILALRPTDAEAIAQVAWWAREDPEPFAGGQKWHRAGEGRHEGGAGALLAATLTIDADWRSDALRRLWLLALRLPIGIEVELEWEVAPSSCQLYAGQATPWPLDLLADALFAAGEQGVVVDAWRDPPGDGSDERPGHLRSWLEHWWLREASTAELAQQASTGPTATAHAALDELLKRPDHGDLVAVARSLAVRGHPWLLGRVAPDELVSVGSQAERGTLLEVATWPGWEHPPTILACRGR